MGFFDRLFNRKPRVLGTLNEGQDVMREASVTPDTIKTARVSKFGIAYVKNASSGRENFEGPTNIVFANITNAYITDSYIRQAVDKHVDFLFKAGYDITGKDQKAIDYVNARIAALEMAIDMSFESFLRQVSEEVVLYHNAFIAKVRMTGSYKYPGNVQAKGVLSKQPVIAYFLLPVDTITIARDVSGSVLKYRQEIAGVSLKGGKSYIDIKPEDMIHIYIDKPTGRAFGLPFLWEVLDDVKILRHLEELTSNMIYKNIFPLYIYKVGKPEPGMQATDEEIDQVREMLGSDFTFDGGLVIPERHAVDIVGSQGLALDTEKYLEYFKKRVFTGLGVSPTLMGEGDTSSRSTADTIDQGFKDRIKSFQRELELFIRDQIFKEMLLEGGIDFITNPDSMVHFRFKEIDLAAKMANENHITQLFTQNAITHDELRRSIGLEPLADAEFERTYSRMITGWLDAQAAAAANDSANAAGTNKNQPTNQSGTKASATTKSEADLKKELYESFGKSIHIDRAYNALKEDVSNAVYRDLKDRDLTFYGEYDIISVEMAISLAVRPIKDSLNNVISSQFMQGVMDFKKDSGLALKTRLNMSTQIKDLRNNSDIKVDSFIINLKEKLRDTIRRSDQDNLLENLNHVFDSLEYRLAAMFNTEPLYAYNLAYIRAAKSAGLSEVGVITEGNCEICKNTTKVSTDSMNIPPFHVNCKCKLSTKMEEK